MTPHDNLSIARHLAEFITEDPHEPMPPPVADQVRRAILDQLACQIIGSTLRWNAAAYDFVRQVGGAGECTIAYKSARVPVQYAAFANAVFGHGAELDDYGVDSGTHSGAVVIPTALAMAERLGSSGREVMAAIAVGYDVAWILGRLMRRELHDSGYHTHAVLSVFSATATAGKLLRLNAAQLAHAMGIAGSHASGTMEYDQTGGEVKRVHSGIAAIGGIHSAFLAAHGLTGPTAIFEGRRGILPVLARIGGQTPSPEYRRYAGVMRNGFKLFPVTASQHSPLAVLTKLVADAGFGPDDVEAIDVQADRALLLHIGSIYEPQEVIQAQFSLPFSLALRLVKNDNNLRDYADPAVLGDPRILALARRVRFTPDDTRHGDKYFCRMSVRLTDGRVITGEAHHPKGHCDDPLTTGEVQAKFRRLTAGSLSVERAEALISSVAALQDATTVSMLMDLLSPP
jgi:2-methylcitrate dehydratase PrpD